MDMLIQDIEDDPEIRDQINLYENKDVIKQLEAQIAGMNLEEIEPKQPKKANKNAKEDRKTVKVVRKTKEGKEKQAEAIDAKKKNELLIKASLKTKTEIEEDGSDWDSVEEDYPHIRVEDLKSIEDQLAGMNIADDEEESDSEEEEEKKPVKGKKK